MHEISVGEDAAGSRLDIFLAHHLPHLSRRSAQVVIAGGSVRVNERRVRKGTLLQAGDRVQVAEEVIQPPGLEANPALEIPILYEDDTIVAVNKPAGIPSLALRADETNTVANFLLSRYPEMRAVGAPLEAGLVHRLDTDTSGVLLAARTIEAHAELRRQFRDREVVKDYLALVTGEICKTGEAKHFLSSDPRDTHKVRVSAVPLEGSRLAVTRYRPAERFRGHTLLEVRIITGERHQIRAQLAALGHPVVGDALYGRRSQVSGRPGRHLLHAARVVLHHPSRKEHLSMTAPLPEEFTRYCETLRRKVPAG